MNNDFNHEYYLSRLHKLQKLLQIKECNLLEYLVGSLFIMFSIFSNEIDLYGFSIFTEKLDWIIFISIRLLYLVVGVLLILSTKSYCIFSWLRPLLLISTIIWTTSAISLLIKYNVHPVEYRRSFTHLIIAVFCGVRYLKLRGN